MPAWLTWMFDAAALAAIFWTIAELGFGGAAAERTQK
jgi:hypothetical protein